MPVRWTTKTLKDKSDDEVLKTILVEKMSTLNPRPPLHKRLRRIATAADKKITHGHEAEPTVVAAMPRVIVRIEGGNFQGAAANMFFDLSILDIDNMDACDPVRNKRDQNITGDLSERLRRCSRYTRAGSSFIAPPYCPQFDPKRQWPPF
jgi:hypothetical protein